MNISTLIPDEYEYIKTISQSNNSKIVLVKDNTTSNKFVLKIIPPKSIFYKSAFYEFYIIKRQEHPNLIRITTFDYLSDKSFYYIMPYYKAINPIELCKRDGEKTFLIIFSQLVEGLDFLHKRGIIHADISFENILVTQEDVNIVVKIADFGLSSLVKMEQIKDISGTAYFVAPEIIKGNVKFNVKSDLYSLGLYLKILLTGKEDFKTNNALEVMKNRLKYKAAVINPIFKIEDGILNIVRKLLDDNPNKRYNSCVDVYKDLQPYLIKNKIDVSHDYFKEKKVKFYFYREKQIDKIIKKINENQVLQLIGDETNGIADIIIFLKAKLSFSFKKVIIFDYNDIKKTEKESNKIYNTLKNNENIEYVFIINKQYAIKNFKKIQEMISKNKNQKFIIIVTPDEIIKEFIRYKIPLFNKNEFENYLNLFFGNGLVNEKFKEYIFKNAFFNLELIKEFIFMAIKQKAIKFSKLKWEFELDKLQIDYSNKIIKKYMSKLDSISKSLYGFLVKLSFWNQEFTVKEIVDIFEISASKTLEYIKKLEKEGILINYSTKIRFMYHFMKIKIKNSVDTKIGDKIRGLIIKYLEKKKELTFDEKMFLLKNLKENNEIKKLISYAYKFSSNYKEEFEKLHLLGEFIFNIGNQAIEADAEKTFAILLKYGKILIPSKKRLLATKIYDFLNGVKNQIKSNSLLQDLLVFEFQIYIVEKKYEEISKIAKLKEKFISELPLNQYLEIKFVIIDANYFLGKIDTSLDIAKELYIKTKDTQLTKQQKVSLYSELAFLYTVKGMLRNGEEFYKKAIENARELTDYNHLVYLYARLALIKQRQFDYSNTKKYLNNAEKYINKGKVLTYQPLVKYSLGFLYLEKGYYWNAFTNFYEAIKLEEKRGLTTITYLLARALEGAGYYNQALFWIEKSYKKVLKIKRNDLIANHLAFIYKILIDLKRFKEAEDVFQEVEEKERKNIIRFGFMPHYFRAKFFYNQNKLADMLKEINEIRKNIKIEKITFVNIFYKYLKAKYYYKTNSIKKSLEYSKTTIAKLSSINDYFQEAPLIYFDAYLIEKKAFKEGITTENYNKLLRKAYQMVIDRKNSLPTNPMQRTYLSQPRIKRIIDEYEVETLNSRYNEKNTKILDFLESVSNIISTVTNEKELFIKILEIAILVTGTERGIIFTLNEKNKPKIRYSVNVDSTSINDITSLSSNIIKNVFSKKKAVFNSKVSSDKVFDRYKSFINLKVYSVIALPLMIHKKIVGVVYLDSKKLISLVLEEIKFLNIFAQIAASAIETSQYYCVLKKDKKQLAGYLQDKHSLHKNIIGNSPQINEILQKIEKIAPTDVNVLLEGESGTGKELFAKDIYQLSRRRNKPFITIDCGSLSEQLIESELFGHVKGAFTGAISDKKGLFEEANGGTVFLDEISNLSLYLQAKLLRLIQEGEFKRVGDNIIRKTDVRIIAASNISLKKLVADGKFRQDLYYRLSIFPIEIPPLREREGDIDILVSYFITYYSGIHNKVVLGIEKNARELLNKYHWPGNVRQLKNEIERAIILCEGKRLTLKEFKNIQKTLENTNKPKLTLSHNFNELITNYKLEVIEQMLRDSDNNWTLAAKKLGISRQNLRQIYNRIKNK